jgi:hypothetical protein
MHARTSDLPRLNNRCAIPEGCGREPWLKKDLRAYREASLQSRKDACHCDQPTERRNTETVCRARELQRQFESYQWSVRILNPIQFPVLSDAEGVAARAYDIGRGFFGLTALARVTFVVDKKGIIRCVLLA